MTNPRMPTKKAALAFLETIGRTTTPAWDTATKEFAIAIKTSMAIQTVVLGRSSVPQGEVIEMAFALLANQERYLATLELAQNSRGMLSREQVIADGLEISVIGPDERMLRFLHAGCSDPNCVIHNFIGTADEESVRTHAAKIIALIGTLIPDFPDLEHLRLLVANRDTTCKRVPGGILLSGRSNSNLN